MIGTRDSHAFAADNRAVSAVIGFILVFGILMLLLTVYQAQIVPQQNAQTEFTHFEQTSDELVDVRNAISRTGQAGDPQFPSVTLGTTYQSRTLTINPAPAAGTLQTSEEEITIHNESTIRNESKHPKTVPTRFIEYQPGYNELDVGSTWYENSVLYVDNPEGDNTILEDQHMVTDGTELNITAIESDFQETGTSRTTIEMKRNQSEVDLPDPEGGNLTVEIPTRLDEDYWDPLDEELDDDPIVYEGVDEEDGILTLNVTSDGAVGVNSIKLDS